VDFIAE
jgi:hypothetical protein